ncbi:hypothetical protein M9H77_25990 [Catharanthus roseus]|uniref:Uncharacterized protein n=1 Tax=Catharanthus roseus TaxID=4058 RepID=A0ACC0AB43_CATRO|nr:hypothetical protein M9H77_25990 [Catharanthus roseus]
MEEDHSWMYRRTVPGVMGISNEFQLGLKHFMVLESKKKRAHPETSTTTLASTLLRTFASPATISTSPVTFTPFPQLSYSSPPPISTSSSSSSIAGTSLRPVPSLSTRPLAPPVHGAADFRIHILLTIDRKGIEGTHRISVPYRTLGRNGPHYVTKT